MRLPDSFEILDDFERFSQVNDVFSRSFWDDEIRDELTDRFYATYRRPLTKWRKANGFTQRDYAVRNASWHVTDVFAEMYEADDRRDGFLDALSMLRDGPEERLEPESPGAAAADLKHVAKTFGADLVGITAFDERFVYTERYSASTGEAKPAELPDGLDHIVVMGQSMDPGLIQTAPSALAGSATGLGYSEDAAVLLSVAQYIRNLGYRAVPSMNDTALAIPLALKAGLGEYGRHGMLITPELGPRLRIGKIFTDLPLAHDQPQYFGVKEFCEQCDRCAAACPARAGRTGARGVEQIGATRGQEVVGRRRGLFRTLVEDQQRLRNLRARVPVHARLQQAVEPLVAPVGGHTSTRPGAMARRQVQRRQPTKAKRLVGASQGLRAGTGVEGPHAEVGAGVVFLESVGDPSSEAGDGEKRLARAGREAVSARPNAAMAISTLGRGRPRSRAISPSSQAWSTLWCGGARPMTGAKRGSPAG